MKYKGFILEPVYYVGSTFTIDKANSARGRKPTSKDVEYWEIRDPDEGMSRHGAERTIKECKQRIDKLRALLAARNK